MGAWERRYIAREGGAPDASVVARYIQTPQAFVDVRVAVSRPSWPDGWDFTDVAATHDLLSRRQSMAFAGVATLGNWDIDAREGTTIRWHAALNLWPPADSTAVWKAIDARNPPATDDEGRFCIITREEDGSGTGEGGTVTTWHEFSLDSASSAYMEEWRRLPDSTDLFCAVRRNSSLLVIAGDWFGYAADSRKPTNAAMMVLEAAGSDATLASSLAFAGANSCTFVVGRISTGWIVEQSAVGGEEGSPLILPSLEGWLPCAPFDSNEQGMLASTSWVPVSVIFEKHGAPAAKT